MGTAELQEPDRPAIVRCAEVDGSELSAVGVGDVHQVPRMTVPPLDERLVHAVRAGPERAHGPGVIRADGLDRPKGVVELARARCRRGGPGSAIPVPYQRLRRAM